MSELVLMADHTQYSIQENWVLIITVNNAQAAPP